MSAGLRNIGALAAAAVLTLASSGCDTEAFCFDKCDGEDGGGAAGGGGAANGGGGSGGVLILTGGGGEGGNVGGGGPCEPTNGGNEICDGIDNDCDGQIDNSDDIDLTSPLTCGTCDNNCFETLLNVAPATVVCEPSQNPGVDPGTCDGECAADYSDLDGDGSCEYFCVQSAVDDVTCNNLDDDCDGVTDEDVDLCTSVTDCGQCGANCVVLNGTPECVHTGMGNCTGANTSCAILNCNPGWVDLDGQYNTGCEYQCTPTNGGVEICGDNIDNDCDGLIDGADSLAGDPNIGVACVGDPDGICGDMMLHGGLTACVGNQVVCAGPNVLFENDVLETCNGQDDDCDGVPDDSPTDAGGSCGVSSNAPCQLGTLVCNGGMLNCQGNIDPSPGGEVCDGVDNDCDGVIDMTNGMPPVDVGLACDVPPTPPMGATTPCQAGSTVCIAGNVICNNSITPVPGAVDTCGEDTNCNGLLENQPDFNSNVNFCGDCNTNCQAGSVTEVFQCNNGMCEFVECAPGFWDLNGDDVCEYACIFNQAQEVCNGFDDNCDGQVDEGVVAPSPVQQCGVSPSATSPECTTGVTVSCVAGGWQCSFPAGVCGPDCASATEVCDTLDNNCDGNINENVPNFGAPCASDDGQPPPGDGACRTFGTFQCTSPTTVACNAVAESCTNLPGGCAELCDGVDNDCDGSIDEPFSSPGSDPTFFYQPDAVQVGAGLWVHRYEVSRPNANATDAGSGNGYWTSAPAGTTLDATPACSEPGRVPWFNVTPIEVEQTCAAMGGFICSTGDWQTTCEAGASCDWGYAPTGAACTSGATGSKYCNLGATFDFNATLPGNQDGLLPTASNQLQACYADLSTEVYDITGNLREITESAPGVYRLMGGAFNSASELGAMCGFDFYTVTDSFKLYDVGFRCCFASDPTN